MALFAERTGLDLVHVPYRAGAPAVAADLTTGRIDMTIGNVASYQGGVRGGQTRALAVTGTARWPALPEVPTMAEAGVPNLVVLLGPGWRGRGAYPRRCATGSPPRWEGLRRSGLPPSSLPGRGACRWAPGRRTHGAGRARDHALGRNGPAPRHPCRRPALTGTRSYLVCGRRTEAGRMPNSGPGEWRRRPSAGGHAWALGSGCWRRRSGVARSRPGWRSSTAPASGRITRPRAPPKGGAPQAAGTNRQEFQASFPRPSRAASGSVWEPAWEQPA